MRRLICWTMFVLLCAAPLARGGEPPSAKDDGKKMDGTWKPVAAELGGKPFPDEILKTMKLAVTDGKYSVTAGERSDEGTLKLDPAKTPRAMDIVGTKGPNQGKTILAIYELTDTTLRVCYDLSGKTRPAEFKTHAETPLLLIEYKRQKP
jgi:uncharacterized protein (TIGR03067 family)